MLTITVSHNASLRFWLTFMIELRIYNMLTKMNIYFIFMFKEYNVNSEKL